MGWMEGETRVVICLGLACIVLALTAGCNYAQYAMGDITEKDCERVTGLDRDHCYQRLAISQGDSTLCAKIDDPGPKSKCYLELGECSRLSFQATGDGAYTKFDCYQYNAIKERSVRLCEEDLDVYVSWNTNDLNPNGVSREICIKRVTENCGHIGQKACYDTHYRTSYCVEGLPGTGGTCISDN